MSISLKFHERFENPSANDAVWNPNFGCNLRTDETYQSLRHIDYYEGSRKNSPTFTTSKTMNVDTHKLIEK